MLFWLRTLLLVVLSPKNQGKSPLASVSSPQKALGCPKFSLNSISVLLFTFIEWAFVFVCILVFFFFFPSVPSTRFQEISTFVLVSDVLSTSSRELGVHTSFSISIHFKNEEISRPHWRST